MTSPSVVIPMSDCTPLKSKYNECVTSNEGVVVSKSHPSNKSIPVRRSNLHCDTSYPRIPRYVCMRLKARYPPGSRHKPPTVVNAMKISLSLSLKCKSPSNNSVRPVPSSKTVTRVVLHGKFVRNSPPGPRLNKEASLNREVDVSYKEEGISSYWKYLNQRFVSGHLSCPTNQLWTCCNPF